MCARVWIQDREEGGAFGEGKHWGEHHGGTAGTRLLETVASSHASGHNAWIRFSARVEIIVRVRTRVRLRMRDKFKLDKPPKLVVGHGSPLHFDSGIFSECGEHLGG